LPKIIKIC